MKSMASENDGVLMKCYSAGSEHDSICAVRLGYSSVKGTKFRQLLQAAAVPAGFTLVELMVVFCTLGIVAGLLMPVLSKAKQAVRSENCVGNLKQLQICCYLYAGDNSGRLPPNNSVAEPDGSPNGITIADGLSWCPDHPQTVREINTAAPMFATLSR
jgi:type II secretory pathway pseudopilin PulG